MDLEADQGFAAEDILYGDTARAPAESLEESVAPETEAEVTLTQSEFEQLKQQLKEAETALHQATAGTADDPNRIFREGNFDWLR